MFYRTIPRSRHIVEESLLGGLLKKKTSFELFYVDTSFLRFSINECNMRGIQLYDISYKGLIVFSEKVYFKNFLREKGNFEVSIKQEIKFFLEVLCLKMHSFGFSLAEDLPLGFLQQKTSFRYLQKNPCFSFFAENLHF